MSGGRVPAGPSPGGRFSRPARQAAHRSRASACRMCAASRRRPATRLAIGTARGRRGSCRRDPATFLTTEAARRATEGHGSRSGGPSPGTRPPAPSGRRARHYHCYSRGPPPCLRGGILALPHAERSLRRRPPGRVHRGRRTPGPPCGALSGDRENRQETARQGRRTIHRRRLEPHRLTAQRIDPRRMPTACVTQDTVQADTVRLQGGCRAPAWRARAASREWGRRSRRPPCSLRAR